MFMSVMFCNFLRKRGGGYAAVLRFRYTIYLYKGGSWKYNLFTSTNSGGMRALTVAFNFLHLVSFSTFGFYQLLIISGFHIKAKY